jgi:hypothetical protein
MGEEVTRPAILSALLFVFFMMTGEGVLAQHPKIISGDSVVVENALYKLNKNINFTIIPGPTYNGSTKIGFAVLPMLTYNLNREDTLSPVSSTSALLYFNFYGSWLTAAKQSLYWNQNKWRAFAMIGYGKLRLKFYGVGTDTAIVSSQAYNWIHQNTFLFSMSCYRKVVAGFYAGLIYNYNNIYIYGEDSLAAVAITQSNLKTETNIESIIAPSFAWDSRDNLFWSSKGFYAMINIMAANSFLFSSHDYSVLTGFVNGYHALLPQSKKLILAWRLYLQGSWGDVPYDQLANYGVGDGFRGYTGGKYVNRSEINIQAEIRYDVWKFVSLSGFLGTGKIFSSIETFGQSVWLPAAGGGIYLNVIPSRNLRAWIAGAVGRHDYGVYVGIGQAF